MGAHLKAHIPRPFSSRPASGRLPGKVPSASSWLPGRAGRLRRWGCFRSRWALHHAQAVQAKLHRQAPVQPLLHPPQSGRDQHLPKRLLAQLHPVILGQVFTRRVGPNSRYFAFANFSTLVRRLSGRRRFDSLPRSRCAARHLKSGAAKSKLSRGNNGQVPCE